MTKLIKTKINKQWDLLLPEHRAVRPEWVEGWEKERIQAMYDFLKPGMTLIDVGAEEGDMPALFATWGVKVFMIEPNERVWSNIRAIWEGNNLKPLGWFAGFAGPIDKEIPEYARRTKNKNGWPVPAYDEVQAEHGFNHLAESPDVISQAKIDTLVEKHKLKVDAITIDVEGSEFEVLKGAEKTLNEQRPVLFISIHPEFMFHNHDYYESHFHGWLHEHGYDGKHLAFDHEHHWEFRYVG